MTPLCKPDLVFWQVLPWQHAQHQQVLWLDSLAKPALTPHSTVL